MDVMKGKRGLLSRASISTSWNIKSHVRLPAWPIKLTQQTPSFIVSSISCRCSPSTYPPVVLLSVTALPNVGAGDTYWFLIMLDCCPNRLCSRKSNPPLIKRKLFFHDADGLDSYAIIFSILASASFTFLTGRRPIFTSGRISPSPSRHPNHESLTGLP